MLHNLKRSGQRWYFDRQIRGILDTPPIHVKPAPWTIVSMVGEVDVSMYILAIKSFYRRLDSGNVVAIVSNRMKTHHITTLKQHISGINIEFIENIDVGHYQRGGCWERLIYILERAKREFVIQLDSDTITIGNNISEIIERVNSNTSFAYVDGNRPITSMAIAGDEAKRSNSNYVGLVLERSFGEWPDADRLKYCRGSAAISGFSRGSTHTGMLMDFHQNMRNSLGHRWREWGTEQCASNFIVANADKVSMLPFPAYSTYPGLNTDHDVKIFHMLGSVRYADGYYVKKGKELIRIFERNQI